MRDTRRGSRLDWGSAPVRSGLAGGVRAGLRAGDQEARVHVDLIRRELREALVRGRAAARPRRSSGARTARRHTSRRRTASAVCSVGVARTLPVDAMCRVHARSSRAWHSAVIGVADARVHGRSPHCASLVVALRQADTPVAAVLVLHAGIQAARLAVRVLHALEEARCCCRSDRGNRRRARRRRPSCPAAAHRAAARAGHPTRRRPCPPRRPSRRVPPVPAIPASAAGATGAARARRAAEARRRRSGTATGWNGRPRRGEAPASARSRWTWRSRSGARCRRTGRKPPCCAAMRFLLMQRPVTLYPPGT